MTLISPLLRFLAAASPAAALIASSAVSAQGDIETRRVRFEKGATSAVVKGSIKGYETIDYLVGARKGQYANVSLATRHKAAYFNILAPGQAEVAFFNGSVSENQYEGVLPKNGDYRIRVYMMRSAARRNEVADYQLEIVISQGDTAATAPPGDAKVAGTGNAMVTGTRPGGHWRRRL